MVSLTRITSPVSRVAASTRAATLTASPTTLNSKRPPPPTLPATTGPELIPSPTLSSPSNAPSTFAAMLHAASKAQSA